MAAGTSTEVSVTAHGAADLALRAEGLPRFGSFDDRGDGTGALSLRPSTLDVGEYLDLCVHAEDDQGSATECLDLRVTEPPGPFPAPRPEFCTEGGTDRCEEALATWDSHMQGYGSRAYCDEEGESMGWVEGHILNAFAFGYLATSDTYYLDKLVEHINGAVCREDEDTENDCERCLFTEETYDDSLDPEWGWYEVSEWYSIDGSTRFDFIVGEGITLQAMVLFIEMVQADPALDADYGADADHYLSLLRDELIPKWDRRELFVDVGDGVGVYLFQDHPGHRRQRMTLPHNQMYELAQALLSMLRVTGESWYRERTTQLYSHFAANTYEEEGLVNWNYWDPAGPWDYDESGDPRHWIGEEHRCGYKGITSTSIIEAARHCVVFDETDVSAVMERHRVYREANDCSVPAVFGYFDEALLEAAFESVARDPTSWGNLVETPRLLWVMDSRARDRTYYECE
jgi:hypothetical protein